MTCIMCDEPRGGHRAPASVKRFTGLSTGRWHEHVPAP
jgi:hypothetical protein